MGWKDPKPRLTLLGKASSKLTDQTEPDQVSQSFVSTHSQWLAVSMGVQGSPFHASQFKYHLHVKFSSCLSRISLSVCHTLSGQLHGRKALCVQQNLWYGDCGSHHMLKTESSKMLKIQ
jgi:hypothetical protein